MTPGPARPRRSLPRPAPDPAANLSSSLHAELDRGVDDYYDGRISHAEFDRRRRRIWEQIRRAGSATWSQVLERIRGELPPAGLAAPSQRMPSQRMPSLGQVEREVRAVTSARHGSGRAR